MNSILLKNVEKNKHLCRYAGKSKFDGSKIYIVPNIIGFNTMLTTIFGNNIKYIQGVNFEHDNFGDNCRYLLDDKSIKIGFF